MAENYEIQLGIKLEDNDFSNIQSQIKSLEKDTVKLNLDTDEADKKINKIKEQWQDLSKGNGKKPSLEINTTSLEDSLGRVESIIREIQKSLGSLDGKNTKNLVASVNKIASALEKATNESDGLVKSLNALSKKDFSFNFNFKTANQNPAQLMTKYGQEADRTVIPALKEQILYLEKAIGLQKIQHYYLKEYRDAEGQTYSSNLRRTALFGTESENKSVTRNKQMLTAETYIKDLKKIASLNHINLDGFNTEFSKSATEIIDDVTKIQSGAKETEEQIEKLKSVFGGIDKEGLTGVLEPIIQDVRKLGEFIDNLSENNSINELTSAFNRLSAALEPLTTNLKNAKDILDNVGNGLGGSTGGTDSGVKNLNNDLKQVTVTADNTADAIDSMKNAMSSMKFNTASIDAATKDLEEMNVAIKEVTAKQGKNFDITVKGINSVGEAVEIVKRFNAETNNFEIISSKISKPFNEGAEAAKKFKKEAETVKNIKFDFEVGKYDDSLSKMDTNFNKLSSASKELRENVEQVKNAYHEMELAMQGTGDEVADRERLIQAEKEYAAALEKTNNLIKIQARVEDKTARADKLDNDIKLFQADIDKWLVNNSAATKQFGSQMLELRAKAEGVDRVKLNGLIQQFKLLDKQADKAGLKMMSLGDKIKSKAKEYMAYFSVAEVFMEVTQAMRAMFNTVKEIDTAMTGLYRVTDLTAAEYDTLFNNMISSAKEYGATLNDIINATTDWVRAGFDADTSLGLAEVTTMYQHISDLDYDTAAENLITAYNGFKDELNSLYDGDTVAAVKYIADVYNELDNSFAVTSAGLGEALTRSASALDLAGNSIQETAGMVTGIVEVTQDPEKAGSALKVLSLRLRGMKGQLEELGEETDENVENISKMQGQILNMTGGKVNIFDASGNFKSTYEIMQGIAQVWDDLSSIDQADLLETIAGKFLARIYRNVYIEYI